MWDLVKFVIGIIAFVVVVRACDSINNGGGIKPVMEELWYGPTKSLEAVDTIHNSGSTK